MKLLFKQRLFSWFDSYDIYNEAGDTVYTVKGEFAWGHQLRIYDATGTAIGCVKQRIFTWLPQYELYHGDRMVGRIQREFTFFKPKFTIDYNGWRIEGNWFEWDYRILNAQGQQIATVQKELSWTDTYVIDVADPFDALCALMVVLAIDADKCSRND